MFDKEWGFACPFLVSVGHLDCSIMKHTETMKCVVRRVVVGGRKRVITISIIRWFRIKNRIRGSADSRVDVADFLFIALIDSSVLSKDIN